MVYKCPKCKTDTVRDEHWCFERCLGCGWYRRILPEEKPKITLKRQEGGSQ